MPIDWEKVNDNIFILTPKGQEMVRALIIRRKAELDRINGLPPQLAEIYRRRLNNNFSQDEVRRIFTDNIDPHSHDVLKNNFINIRDLFFASNVDSLLHPKVAVFEYPEDDTVAAIDSPSYSEPRPILVFYLKK